MNQNQDSIDMRAYEAAFGPSDQTMRGGESAASSRPVVKDASSFAAPPTGREPSFSQEDLGMDQTAHLLEAVLAELRSIHQTIKSGM
jgi:hypothetical protein